MKRTAELLQASDAVPGTAVPLLLRVTLPRLVGSRALSNTTSRIEFWNIPVAPTGGTVYSACGGVVSATLDVVKLRQELFAILPSTSGTPLVQS